MPGRGNDLHSELTIRHGDCIMCFDNSSPGHFGTKEPDHEKHVDSGIESPRHAHLLRCPPRYSAGASGCSSRPRRHCLRSRFSPPRLYSPVARALHSHGSGCTFGNSHAMPRGGHREFSFLRRRYGRGANGVRDSPGQRQGTQDFQGTSSVQRRMILRRGSSGEVRATAGGQSILREGRWFKSIPRRFCITSSIGQSIQH